MEIISHADYNIVFASWVAVRDTLFVYSWCNKQRRQVVYAIKINYIEFLVSEKLGVNHIEGYKAMRSKQIFFIFYSVSFKKSQWKRESRSKYVHIVTPPIPPARPLPPVSWPLPFLLLVHSHLSPDPSHSSCSSTSTCLLTPPIPPARTLPPVSFQPLKVPHSRI